jgi:hypothetical protein
MTSCIEELLSAMFIGVTGRFRLTHEDRAMEAEDQLDKLLQQLDKRRAILGVSCATSRSEAVALRGDRSRCRAKLLEHKRARAQYDRLISYRDMVLQHMDALKCTELNKSLISTLQESSKTLKSLGVMDGVKQAELVVQDVETSMQQVHELTSILGTPMDLGIGLSSLGNSDMDLDKELELLMGDETSNGYNNGCLDSPKTSWTQQQPMQLNDHATTESMTALSSDGVGKRDTGSPRRDASMNPNLLCTSPSTANSNRRHEVT